MPVSVANANEAEPHSLGQPAITDDLVREVADQVFALLLLDLRIDQERRHQPYQAAASSRGGR